MRPLSGLPLYHQSVPMIRFLQVLLGVILVRLLWTMFRSARARHAAGRTTADPGPAGRIPGADYRGEVVGCERCGLHVPKPRAVNFAGRTFCSRACAGAGPGDS